MAQDKFAPQADDGPDKIHHLHLDLIKQQRDEAKKARDARTKEAVHHQDETQPSEAPGGNEAAAGASVPSAGGPSQ